jgi:hypothetical protein
MTEHPSIPHASPPILEMGMTALGIGVIFVAASFVGWGWSVLRPHADPEAFFSGWLFAWLFWTGVSLGSMAIVMLFHCTGGRWGALVGRLGEHAAMVLPLMMVLFVPLLFGLKYVYPWADPTHLAHDPVLQLRHPYLNGPWFAGRTYFYLAAFSVMAYLLRRWSLASDTDSSIDYAGRQSRLSAGGMVFYFVFMTLASIDWILSREAHWYSTVYGFITVVGQTLSGMCFLLIMLWAMRDKTPFDKAIEPKILNDEGTLLLLLVVLWAYMALSQLLVIWMGNLQTDITWYEHRVYAGWRAVCWILVIGHFFIPFVLLLRQSNKRDARRLGMIALALFVLRIVDMAWMVLPSSTAKKMVIDGVSQLPAHGVSWMDFTALIGIGGLWFAAFCWLAGDHPLVPIRSAVNFGLVNDGTASTSSPIG